MCERCSPLAYREPMTRECKLIIHDEKGVERTKVVHALDIGGVPHVHLQMRGKHSKGSINPCVYCIYIAWSVIFILGAYALGLAGCRRQ